MSRLRVAFVIALFSFFSLAQAAVAGINFTGGELTNVPPRPEFMVSGDLNNDGRTDVVVVSPASKELSTYLAADTPSHFAPATVVRVGQHPERLALGDLNADGRLDVIVTDPPSDSVWILIGTGSGTYLAARQINVPNSIDPAAVAVGNFDDTGNLDLAIADGRLAKVFILLNDNANPPVFRRGGDFNVGEVPTEILSADLNADGKRDIVTLNLGGPAVKEISVSLWRRVAQGFPEFESSQRYTIGEKPSGMLSGDFNNDGDADIAMLNRARGADGNYEIDVLVNRGEGVFNPPIVLPVPCPFFTGGSPCRALSLAAGDFDANGNLDFVVGLADPRRTRGSASSESDALQIFAGRGDGTFVPGGVFSTQKVPISVVVGDLTGDGTPDVAVANQRTLDLQAFINTSSPGMTPNGEPCLLGEECLSDRCTNGVCCASACSAEDNEVCNIIGREGICIPIPPVPTECTEPDGSAFCEAENPAYPFCVQGWCCDEECIGGRCDIEGLIGVCIPGIPDGEPCSGDDRECESGFCSDNFICCRETCEGGFCEPGTGVCRDRGDPGENCQEDEECKSGVCDVFDAICCNRVCDPDTETCFPGEGICRPVGYTPSPRPETPTATRTPTPRPVQEDGEDCFQDVECQSGICDDAVCCKEECDDDHHCELGSGDCVEGPAPTSPTPTLIPTPLATRTPEDPCENISCPGGQQCLSGLCVSNSTGGGCSTGGSDPAPGNWIAVMLLPLTMWAGRRWQLHRARATRRSRG